MTEIRNYLVLFVASLLGMSAFGHAYSFYKLDLISDPFETCQEAIDDLELKLDTAIEQARKKRYSVTSRSIKIHSLDGDSKCGTVGANYKFRISGSITIDK